MSCPVLMLILDSDGGNHAGRAEQRLALCGARGRCVLVRVTGAFDVDCPCCATQVVDLLDLTALTDPTNVQMRIVEGGS